jgi:hypothetical protein
MKADLIFINGSVYTVDAARSWAGDVPGSVEFLKRSALPTLSR